MPMSALSLGLEELDRVAPRVFDQYLLPANSADDRVAKGRTSLRAGS